MWPILIGVFVFVVVAVVIWRRNSGPPVAMFGEIDRALSQVQKQAVENVTTAVDDNKVRMVDEERMRKQVIVVNNIFRIVYTVEAGPDGLMHTISSQLCKARSKKYHIQCMLIVMLILSRQLEEAGLKQDDVQFDVAESELGTQYVGMLLTSEQHEKLVQQIK